MFGTSMRLVFEKHTCVCLCRLPANRNDPWYDSMKSEIIAAKIIVIGQKNSTYKIQLV